MGLDVPVDDAAAVGMLQACGDLHGEMEGLLPVEGAPLLHVLLQGDAVDQLHDDVVRSVGGGDVIDLNDIGVAQHGHGFALRPEAAAELFVPGEFIFEYLDGHQPVQPMASCFIHDGHAAGTEDLKDLVPVIQQPSDILIHWSNAPFPAGQIRMSTAVTLSGAPRLVAMSRSRLQHRCLPTPWTASNRIS